MMANGNGGKVSVVTAVMAILTAISITVAVVVGVSSSPSTGRENRERIIVLETTIIGMREDIQDIKQAVVK